MSALKYKTRGMKNPQGLQRVFFCAHPKDHARFFESISDEILAKQNCAVWYKESYENVEYTEEFLNDLKQMQLFVMPVSSELLYTKNNALDIEFRFAIENHIPVLPLMQENGLDKAFNEKCGDLQYLDKNNRDATAISYDEKLEKYLETVLIGDELAARIRNAFDAYVFLSYRKKDRRYAQELMRLIHKNDFCRDIAIWYDEFLTPGENFNDSIKAALEKSGLFVLTVTPNLINEVNYIMTTEYPMAKGSGKPIIPAELVETDKEMLAKSYDGIPACADAHNAAELSEALLNAIKKIAVKENDKDPLHNFFIGLAYLSGIDVEVDHKRALALITSSAEAGLLEAMEKLVEMYRGGIGVKRDYSIAVEWQERIILEYENIYNAEQNEYNLNELFWKMIECGDAYKELGKISKAKAKYEQAMRCASKPELLNVSENIKRALSVSYERLGNIFKAEGDLRKAREYYRKGLEIAINIAEIAINIAEESETIEAMRGLSISYERLGDIAKAEGDLRKAREYYQKGLEIAINIAEESETIEAMRGLSISYERLGDIAKAEGDITKAREYYQKGLDIDINIAEESETIEAMRDISISYERLGDIAKAEGDLRKAREYYQKGLEIAINIAEESETIEAMRDLSVSYERLGNIAKAEGDITNAKEYYQKGLEIFIKIAKESETIEAMRDLSVSYNRLGNIAKAEGNITEAKEYYNKCLEIFIKIAEESETIEAMRDLSISYNKLGDIAKAEGNLRKAREYYQKDIEICIKIAEESETAESYDDLAISYYKMSFVEPERCKEYLIKAVEIYEMLCRNCPGVARYKKNLEIIKGML